MQVMTIISQDDAGSGEVTAVLEFPEGTDQDAFFLAWLRQNPYWRNKPDRYCLEENTFAWNVYTVRPAIVK